MSGQITPIETLKLSGSKGKIMITTISQPYGEKSESVASIGITLKADATEPDWKVHIPKANIEEVIKALQKAQQEL